MIVVILACSQPARTKYPLPHMRICLNPSGRMKVRPNRPQEMRAVDAPKTIEATETNPDFFLTIKYVAKPIKNSNQEVMMANPEKTDTVLPPLNP